MIFDPFYKHFVSNEEDTKRYSDFIGLIVRMSFCVSVGVLLHSKNSTGIVFYIDRIASYVFFTFAIGFLPFIEDKINDASNALRKTSKNKIIKFIQRTVQLLITLAIFFGILRGIHTLVSIGLKT